ncbi:MAG: DUF3667 domain-containing protein [Myxococcota bacterium]
MIVCANCGETGSGKFCSACGQRLDPRLPTAQQWFAEVTDAFLNVDGRVAKTLRLLLTQPGTLTVDMIEGRRARHVSPLRLYLACSIVYFFVANVTPEQKRFMFATFDFGDGQNRWLAEALPRLMFLLVPLVALLQKALFQKQQPSYTAHLISVLHLFSCWYLIFTLDRLFSTPMMLDPIPWWAYPCAAVSVVLQVSGHVYFFFAMRRLFGQGVALTIGKQFLWILGFSILLALSVLALAAATGHL